MTNSEVLARIMELQVKGDLTASEREELARLETEWSNRWCDDYPSRR
jgi:hypothetical protein